MAPTRPFVTTVKTGRDENHHRVSIQFNRGIFVNPATLTSNVTRLRFKTVPTCFSDNGRKKDDLDYLIFVFVVVPASLVSNGDKELVDRSDRFIGSHRLYECNETRVDWRRRKKKEKKKR